MCTRDENHLHRRAAQISFVIEKQRAGLTLRPKDPMNSSWLGWPSFLFHTSPNPIWNRHLCPDSSTRLLCHTSIHLLPLPSLPEVPAPCPLTARERVIILKTSSMSLSRKPSPILLSKDVTNPFSFLSPLPHQAGIVTSPSLAYPGPLLPLPQACDA